MRKKVKIITILLVVLVVVIAGIFLTKKWWAGADVISPDQTKNLYQTDLNNSSIIYVKIPAGVTKGDVENIAKQKNKDKSKEDLLNKAVDLKFDELEPQIVQIEKTQSISSDQQQNFSQDYIIVYIDENDNPILPDADRDQSLLTTFQDRENNELTFKWDSSWDTIDPVKVRKLKEALNKAYPEMKKIYGRPAFNITINIKYEPLICGGMYNAGINEISLNDYEDPSKLIHESLHAFRDDYVLGCSSGGYEEGMVQLATQQIVFALDLKNINSALKVAWPNYEYTNRPDISSPFKVFDQYIDGAAVWSKLLNEDSNFLINFNQRYYSYRRNHPTDYDFNQYVPWLISRVKPEVEKEPFIDWYQKQYIFHQNYSGYQLGSRVIYVHRNTGMDIIDSQFLDLFYSRNIVAKKSYIVKDGIKIQIFGPNSQIVYDNIQNINNEGKYSRLELDNILDNSGVSQGRFRIELSTKAESDNWKLKSTNYIFYLKDMKTPAGSSIYASIYGVIDNKNNGQVTIKSLTKPDMKPVTVSVDDGIFYTAEFAGTAGLFQLDYTSPDGKTTATRYFTKDYRSSSELPYYYVYVSTDKQKPQFTADRGRVNNISANFRLKTNERTNIYFIYGKNQAGLQNYIYRTLLEANEEKIWTITLGKNTTYYYQFLLVDMNGNITKTDIKSLKTTNESSPIVINSSPINGAKNVPVDISQITLQFDKSLDPKTVNKNHIWLIPSVDLGLGVGLIIPLIDYQVSYDETAKKIIVKPKEKLQYNVEYSLFTTSGITDTKGNPVDYIDYTLTTQIVPGSTEPKVISLKPEKSAEGIPTNTTIEAVFNNEINPTDTTNIFQVWYYDADNNYHVINGKTSVQEGNKLVFTPDNSLPLNSTIHVYGEFVFKDKVGNWIIKPKYWEFKTVEN